MKKYLDLGTKISNININQKWFNDSNNSKIDVYIFLNYLKENIYLQKTDEIYKIINKVPNIKIFLEVTNFLSFEEKNLLFAIIIFKSISKISINPTISDITYVNSDVVINNVYNYYTNFLIYYNYESENSIEIKKKIFKLISILYEEKIIFQKIIQLKDKTIKEWSFNFEIIIPDAIEYLNISHTPYQIIIYDSIKYLKGNFFTKVFKIFKENIRSGERFVFKNDSYIENMIKIKLYIDKTDIEDILKILEKNSLKEINDFSSFISLQKNINNLNSDIIWNIKKKNDIKSKIFLKYDEKIKNEIVTNYLDFTKEKNKQNIFVVETFIDFCINILLKQKVYIKTEYKYEILYNIIKIMEIEFKNNIFFENVKGDTEKIVEILNNYWKKIIKIENKYDINSLSIIDDDYMTEVLNNIYAYKKNYIINKELKEKTTHLDAENKKNYSLISKLLLYYNLYALKEYNLNNDCIFLPFYFDFRGRQYYYSSISPTNYKFVRYLINYGIYTNKEVENENINDISNIIDIYKSQINEIKNFFNINRNSRVVNESIFWLLISLGKIIMKKNKTEISIEELLENGKKTIYSDIEFKNDIDVIECHHYTKILKSLKEDKIICRVILKDATASFIQNLIRLMGHKNENSLKYANLSSQTHWYDTYSFILNKWIENNKNDPQKLTLFTRKTVKKTIMTNPYSATYLTAFEYFKEAVEEEFGITIFINSEEEKVFKEFYKYISTKVENEFFLKNSSKKILEYINKVLNNTKKKIVIESHDSETNLTYYKLFSKNFDMIITIPTTQFKKRITKRYKEIDRLEIDHRKINTSIRANWVHYIDGLLIRDINRNSNKFYITIHDCFVVDFLSVSHFIINANTQSNVKIFENNNWNNENQKFFSIFIFI